MRNVLPVKLTCLLAFTVMACGIVRAQQDDTGLVYREPGVRDRLRRDALEAAERMMARSAGEDVEKLRQDILDASDNYFFAIFGHKNENTAASMASVPAYRLIEKGASPSAAVSAVMLADKFAGMLAKVNASRLIGPVRDRHEEALQQLETFYRKALASQNPAAVYRATESIGRAGGLRVKLARVDVNSSLLPLLGGPNAQMRLRVARTLLALAGLDAEVAGWLKEPVSMGPMAKALAAETDDNVKLALIQVIDKVSTQSFNAQGITTTEDLEQARQRILKWAQDSNYMR